MSANIAPCLAWTSLGAVFARFGRMKWLKDRSLTVTLMGAFVLCWLGLVATGFAVFNEELADHGRPVAAFTEYLRSGMPWEATFENWESEFFEMGFFVVLTVFLVQKGSAESRRPGAMELVDADPRDFQNLEGVPGPVRRGGWQLWIYERSLGIAFFVLFLAALGGHLYTGWQAEALEASLVSQPPPSLGEYGMSAKFWFQSLQNWQSEFLGIAAMVWLSVYLRHRGSPESKPVHASHDETGR
jgi:hypothetical protein